MSFPRIGDFAKYILSAVMFCAFVFVLSTNERGQQTYSLTGEKRNLCPRWVYIAHIALPHRIGGAGICRSTANKPAKRRGHLI